MTSVQAITFSSKDRNFSAQSSSADYEVDVPAVSHVSEVRLGSLELGHPTQYTIEKDVNDTIHLHEGFVIGHAVQGVVYENELRVTDCGVETSVFIPSHDNVAQLTISNLASGRADVLVTTDAPHGLFSGGNSASARIMLLCSPVYEGFLVADNN